MDCCGEKRSSAFCPVCGRELTNSLGGLLKHVRDQQRRHEERLAERVRIHGPDDTTPKDRQTVLKWKTWGDLLEAIVKGKS